MESSTNFIKYFFLAIFGLALFIWSKDLWMKYVASFIVGISFIVITIASLFSKNKYDYG